MSRGGSNGASNGTGYADYGFDGGYDNDGYDNDDSFELPEPDLEPPPPPPPSPSSRQAPPLQRVRGRQALGQAGIAPWVQWAYQRWGADAAAEVQTSIEAAVEERVQAEVRKRYPMIIITGLGFGILGSMAHEWWKGRRGTWRQNLAGAALRRLL